MRDTRSIHRETVGLQRFVKACTNMISVVVGEERCRRPLRSTNWANSHLVALRGQFMRALMSSSQQCVKRNRPTFGRRDFRTLRNFDGMGGSLSSFEIENMIPKICNPMGRVSATGSPTTSRSRHRAVQFTLRIGCKDRSSRLSTCIQAHSKSRPLCLEERLDGVSNDQKSISP